MAVDAVKVESAGDGAAAAGVAVEAADSDRLGFAAAGAFGGAGSSTAAPGVDFGGAVPAGIDDAGGDAVGLAVFVGIFAGQQGIGAGEIGGGAAVDKSGFDQPAF